MQIFVKECRLFLKYWWATFSNCSAETSCDLFITLYLLVLCNKFKRDRS